MLRFVKARSLRRANSKESLDSSGDSPRPRSMSSSQHSPQEVSSRTLSTTPSSAAANNNNLFVVARNDHSKLGTTVRQILDNPSIAARFKEYAASLHADEGLRFLDELQTAYDQPDQASAAARLMRRFFLDDAEDQVNLPDHIRSELIDRYESRVFDSVAELFNDATYEVFTDIKKSDTFRNFLMVDEEAKRISSDGGTLLLDGWVVSENFRLALQAVSDDSSLCNLVRFCTSVSEFEKEEDRTAKKARGNKIAATFIQTGSTFQVAIPQYYADAILAGRYLILTDARIESLQILAKNQALMEAVRKSLTQVRGSHERPSKDFGQTSRAQDLQAVFSSGQGKKFVQKLQESIGMPQGLLNKARFCSAVVSFLSMPDSGHAEKLGTARKIVATYVQVGSMFQVELASGFVDDLCLAKHPDYAVTFSVIYQQFISDMGSDALVSQVLDLML